MKNHKFVKSLSDTFIKLLVTNEVCLNSPYHNTWHDIELNTHHQFNHLSTTYTLFVSLFIPPPHSISLTFHTQHTKQNTKKPKQVLKVGNFLFTLPPMASEQARRKDDNIIDTKHHQIQIKKTRDPKRGGGTDAVKVQIGSDFHLTGPGAIHVTNAEERPKGVKFEVHSQRNNDTDNVKESTSHGLDSTGIQDF